MDYKDKYLKYKSKYLGLKAQIDSSNVNNLDQEGGRQTNADKSADKSDDEKIHETKTSLDIAKLSDIMTNVKVTKPDKSLTMPSSTEVSKNRELSRLTKNSKRLSRPAYGIDIYQIQPKYYTNPSKAIAKFLELSQLYGRNNFFKKIYDYFVNYGSSFINNSIMFDSINSTILQENLATGTFVFQLKNGFIFQVNAVNVGIVGYIGVIRAIIWSWVQNLYSTNTYYFDRIVTEINSYPELQQATGITSYSGTSISYVPGYMDAEEWYYMMIIGFLTRSQGYFLMSNGAGTGSYSYYLITSVNQL